MNRKSKSAIVLVQTIVILVFASSKLKADMGTCGGVTTTVPFTDVGSSIFFCQIAEAYFSGLTNGTSAGTHSPGADCNPGADGSFHHAPTTHPSGGEASRRRSSNG